MVPLIVQQIATDLEAKQLSNIGPTDAAIARTSEGTAFIDVLALKNQHQRPDRSAKDYDMLKWEEEVRAQLAQKKGQQKKLTPDEQAKVNAQLAKETRIRENVHSIELRLRRGMGIIQSLATGPPTEAESWMNTAVLCLLDVISAGAALLVGDSAATAYIVCAERISPRLGSIRPFIGVATLRALGTTHLSQELLEEPLGGMFPLGLPFTTPGSNSS